MRLSGRRVAVRAEVKERPDGVIPRLSLGKWSSDAQRKERAPSNEAAGKTVI